MQSLSLRSDNPLEQDKFMPWLQELLAAEGQKILRSKGIMAFNGDDDRYVFQGVHMMLEGSRQRAWKPDEKRESRLVFIDRELPEALRRSRARSRASVSARLFRIVPTGDFTTRSTPTAAAR